MGAADRGAAGRGVADQPASDVILEARDVVLSFAATTARVAVAAAGAGLLAAELFLRAQFGVPLEWPGAGYYLSVLAGLVLSLGVIAATLPVLDRITGPEVARND